MTPRPERLAYLRYAFEHGMSVREVARYTGMDPWFLHQMKQIADELKVVAEVGHGEDRRGERCGRRSGWG